jgi:predicted adenine nucleotide alpha hydrolase (AANH) superfamily ATPase
MSYVYELLQNEFDVTAFYINPNISPEKEYLKRLNELERFSQLKGFDLIEGEYNQRSWVSRVKKFRFEGERSERCRQCIRMRLEATFRKAAETGAERVATVLTISPHKDADMINTLGKELEEEYGIPFLAADFKKKGGFQRSVELTREYGFFRQNYCGCIYSKMERSQDSLWYKNTLQKKVKRTARAV